MKATPLFILGSLLFFSLSAHALYYLCGSDEGGCDLKQPQGCLCMPHDGPLANRPYCLNFDNVSCQPKGAAKSCQHGLEVKDQGTCLALAFQSMPDPLCPLVSYQFCQQHHVALCDQDGSPSSCRIEA